MALTDYKISSAEVNAVHVEAQPTVLRGTAQQNKKVFDAYSDLIVQKHNALCDAADGAITNTIDATVLALYADLGWIPEN